MLYHEIAEKCCKCCIMKLQKNAVIHTHTHTHTRVSTVFSLEGKPIYRRLPSSLPVDEPRGGIKFNLGRKEL